MLNLDHKITNHESSSCENERMSEQTYSCSELDTKSPRSNSAKRKLSLLAYNSKSYFKSSKKRLGVINEEEEPNSIKNSQRSKHPLWLKNQSFNSYNMNDGQNYKLWIDASHLNYEIASNLSSLATKKNEQPSKREEMEQNYSFSHLSHPSS